MDETGPGKPRQASSVKPASPSRGSGVAAALHPWALLSPNLLWLALFMAAPLSLLFVISLKGYEPGRGIIDLWQVANYTKFLSDPFYRQILFDTLLLGFEVTAVALIVGFPLALSLSRSRRWQRGVLYFAVLMPLLTSAVVRTFGWMILLGNNGFINRTLIDLGVIDAPIRLMYAMTGVVIALAEVLLPFMILALDAALLNIPPRSTRRRATSARGGARVPAQVTFPLRPARPRFGFRAGVHAGGQRVRDAQPDRRAARAGDVDADLPAGA